MTHSFFSDQQKKKKTNLHAQHTFCLFLPLLCTTTTMFWRTKCYTGRLTTTIFSATQRCNAGTMLSPFETMLQRCVALKIVMRIVSCNITLKRQTSQLHVIFMEELSYVLTQYFVSCVHVLFYFSLPLIFTLQASPCWPLAYLTVSLPLRIFMFFFLQNSSFLFSITRSSAFSVIHVSVNIKNNVEKDTTLLLYFFLKVKATRFLSK